MKFALVDLKFPAKKANRDHTGGFGSFMNAGGAIGGFVSQLKSSFIELPVLTLAVTAPLLRQAGHEARIVHSGDVDWADVAILAGSMHCHADELEWCREQKRRNPGLRVGFYGPFPYEKPEFYEGVADFIIGGELETTIQAFLDGTQDLEGRLNHGVVKDMRALPAPDWDDWDWKRFSYFPLLRSRPFFPVQSTRGCSFNCDFCPYMASQSKLFRRRTPEQVVDELERNVRKYGMKSFLFRDICFTLNKKHAAAIAEGIIARSLDLEWGCETRLDCLDETLIDLLVKSGMRGVNIGIETGSNEILQASGKKNPALEQQEKIIAYLHKAGVRVNGFYMLGLIGDTSATMMETIKYAERLNTHGAQFCVMTPFPGTPLYEQIGDKLLHQDFTKFTEYEPVVDIGTATPAEVADAHARAYKDYYLRLGWLLKRAPGMVMGALVNRLS